MSPIDTFGHTHCNSLFYIVLFISHNCNHGTNYCLAKLVKEIIKALKNNVPICLKENIIARSISTSLSLARRLPLYSCVHLISSRDKSVAFSTRGVSEADNNYRA